MTQTVPSNFDRRLSKAESIQSTLSSRTTDSESSRLLSNVVSTLSTTPPTSRFSTQRQSSIDSSHRSSAAQVTTLELHPAVTVSFAKGSRLFRLKFSRISIAQNAAGGVRSIELGEGNAAQPDSPGPYLHLSHTFPGVQIPIPHTEQPIVANKAPAYVVSFLEEQTVQTGGTLFSAQPHYTFDDREDFILFQETLLNQRLVFIAGIAEASSKGRGEECVSQNIRIFKSKSGQQAILLFTNSQRKRENKRYISIPLDGVDHIDEPKKASKPIQLKLRPNNELLTQLKSLQIQFLDENDRKIFGGLVCAGVGVG